MRYIIIEKEKGIFLGNYMEETLFSNSMPFPITKAYSFHTIEDAISFAEFISSDGREYEVKVIETDKKYIPIDILIKSGYGKHTKRMLKYTPVISESIH